MKRHRLFSLCMSGLLLGSIMPVEAFSTTGTEIQQQVSSIKGQVVDSNGAPLIGVNVSIKGKTLGTITDMDGAFIMNANIGARVKTCV